MRARVSAMVRVGLVVLVILLVLAPAAPAVAYWRGGFWIGLGTGMLLTAPFWYGAPPVYSYAPPAPYPYPYAYPYPYPYAYPTPPPAATPTTPTPSPLSPPAAGAESPGASAARRCETVTVEGHYETYVTAAGQASTVWVPAGPREICQ